MNSAYDKYDKNKGPLLVLTFYQQWGSNNNSECTSFNSATGVTYPTIPGKEGEKVIDECSFVNSYTEYDIIGPNKEVLKKNISPYKGELISLLAQYVQNTDIENNEKLQIGGNDGLTGIVIRQDGTHSLHLTVPKAGIYTVRVYSINGKELGFMSALFDKGTHQILSDTRLSSQNITLFEVRCENSKVIKKVVGIQ